ncbi:MAG: hypothetical protein ABSC41_12740 [Acidimicrobiales bacterium]
MTKKTDFSDDEWKQVLEGPPSAGLVVITAARGGMLRETWAMSKAYAEARRSHGASELLDEIVAAKPAIDHTRYHTPDEVRDHCLQHIRQAVSVLETKATAEELEAYRRFVVAVADKVAAAHREGADSVSPPETQALGQIKTALGATA